MTATLADSESETIARAKALFEERYPDIERFANLQHRRLHGHMREDAVAETVGWTWKMFRAKVAEGVDPLPILHQMIRYAAGHVRAGKLLGRNSSRSPAATSLSTEEGVRDLHHRVPGPAAEAICELDFQDWLRGLSDTQRGVAEGLVAGNNLTEIAEQKGVSKAAVQQTAAKVRQSLGEFRGR